MEGPSYLGARADTEDDEDEEDECEEGADEEAEDVATSKADDVVPPSSTEVQGSKADAPSTSAQAPDRDLGKALATDE